MPSPKWLVVAKNEYRIHTSGIRSIRLYFPVLAVGLLAAYLVFVTPSFVALFIDDFLAFIITQVAVPIIQTILFVIFFCFIVIPVSNTLREEQAEQMEIFLAAPIKPSGVLLGKFLGVMPFYAIAAVFITGTFTAFTAPLGFDLVQTVITILVFLLTFFSALWIGTVTAAVLRTRLGKTAQGRDIGKALALVIALPIITAMYAIMGEGLSQALADPVIGGMIRTFLGVLPSSWGADIIISFVSNPGNIAAVGFETLVRFGGLAVFFIALLWLGAMSANHAINLETVSFAGSTAKPDGVFYKTIRFLGGGRSFGTLLVSVFKDYSRRLENTSKIAYTVGLFVIVSVLLIRPEDPEASLVVTQLIFPVLAAFVAGEVTLRGKESLLIYRKTPSGVGRFVKARLLHGWLIVVPIAATVTVISTALSPQIPLAFLLANTGLTILTVSATVTFTLGLFLLNPAFSNNSGNYVLNLMIVMQGWAGLALLPLLVIRRMLGLGLYESIAYLTVPMSWLLGAILLYLGKRRLSRLE